MDIKLKVGLRIRELRLKEGLSQEKLAELAQLHRTYISSLELGQRNISLVNIDGENGHVDHPKTEYVDQLFSFD
jgi:transcriptional regulator with XRE-family HTH domain